MEETAAAIRSLMTPENLYRTDGYEAGLAMGDNDLWILAPEQRYGLEGKEGVRQWEEAVQFVEGMVSLAEDPELFTDATQMLLADALARAEEALRRARERMPR
ncbi:MAG: hypothetical protein JOZ19_11380 [Rubrobacter sp.]|nr:hypothetical protein [Rubrobacter sp.]